MSSSTVGDPKHAPKEPHWAIVIFEPVYVAAARDSALNPERVAVYTAYVDECEWVDAVKALEMERPGEYFAFRALPAKVELKIEVSLATWIPE